MNDTAADVRSPGPRPSRTALPVLSATDALHSEARDLHHALSDLMRVYQFRDRDRVCCYDVSVAQCNALDALVRRGAITLNELAAELFLDKSTASRVVDGLERKGYVERRTHPEDRRALLLEATAAGRELQARIEREVIDEEAKLLADFDPEVRRSMTRLISRLARAAAARVDTTGGSCCRID